MLIFRYKIFGLEFNPIEFIEIRTTIIVMRKFLQFFHCPSSLISKFTIPGFEQIKLAIWKQQIDKISQLLSEGAPTHQKGQSILHFATIESKAEAVQFISSHYSDLINQKNEDGDTPLMLALFSGNLKIIKCLLPFSNQNLRDNNGNTPFIIAAANGNIAILQVMVQSSNNTMIRNFEGQSALHRAAYNGQLQAIKLLLAKTNLKLYQVDRNNNNALHMACMSANIICVRYMVKKVKEPARLLDAKNKQDKTPIQVLEDTINKINEYKKSERLAINIQEVRNYIFSNEP